MPFTVFTENGKGKLIKDNTVSSAVLYNKNGGKVMKKKFFLAGLTSLCLACFVAGFAACAPDAPEAQEGTIYQTGIETFWVGVGKAYMTFEYAEEPESPEE